MLLLELEVIDRENPPWGLDQLFATEGEWVLHRRSVRDLNQLTELVERVNQLERRQGRRRRRLRQLLWELVP